MTVVVCDTSVLSYLALMDRLDLLSILFGRVIIPEAVLAECLHLGAPEHLRMSLLPNLPAFAVVRAAAPLLPETTSLDSGEAEAITIAWQHRADSLLLLDEKRGRAVAASLGLKVRGLLGLIVEAHRRSLLDFDLIMTQLKQHGFRVSDSLVLAAHRELGLV